MATLLAAEPFMIVDEVRAAEACENCITDETPDELIEQWIDEASDILANVTGMRVAGQFSLVARPCRSCSICECFCDCCHLDAIPLGDPKPLIDEVRIDGDVIPPDEYDLHWGLNGWSLVRIGDGITRPPNWPSYQDRWKAATETRTFAIYLTVGIPSSHTLIRNAMLEIICRFAASGAGANGNTLAPGIVSAQLGNTTVAVDTDETARIEAGEVGPAVTELLGIFAPMGRETVAVYAPELHGGWDLNLRPNPPIGS